MVALCRERLALLKPFVSQLMGDLNGIRFARASRGAVADLALPFSLRGADG